MNRLFIASMLLISVCTASAQNEPPSGDLAKLQGIWKGTTGQDGRFQTVMTVKRNTGSMDNTSVDGKKIGLTYKFELDEKADPRRIHMYEIARYGGNGAGPEHVYGIYKFIDDNTITFCNGFGGHYPTEFVEGDRGDSLSFTLKRETAVNTGQQSRGPSPDSQYRLGPDSLPQEGVPKGELRGPFTLPSQVYRGTQHTYWVYVPAQYNPSLPAALMVYQDGQAFKDEKGDMRAQNVMDNLIYRREIPVMIGVFINPGRRPDQPEPNLRNWGDRDTNRPTEYNALDDKYARVITEELMPALRKDFNISQDPEMHGIGGSSSGAIAAFTVAWQRPNDFRKVLSNVGSFVNLRGGHVYPEKVLASERKPIRVFLCDGRNDNRGVRNGRYDPSRDWFFQNVRLMKALAQKGYDVSYTWGMNAHGQKFGGAILPEMMRWLWRDGPVSTDPKDSVERAFRQPVASKQ